MKNIPNRGIREETAPIEGIFWLKNGNVKVEGCTEQRAYQRDSH